MNVKFLFPTFRNRYLFVKSGLSQLAANNTFQDALNLGTGEGDYDPMIAARLGGVLYSCDINEADIQHASQINAQVPNIRYQVDDALQLSFENDRFDLLVSCEVIEHVGRPEQMIREIQRVLKPGGYAILTFPSREFPFTYDPVNRIWSWLTGEGSREYLVSQGAYAFGHEYLIGSDAFKQWVRDAGMEIHRFVPLSSYLIALLEMYWTGWVQRIFKKNAGNVTSDTGGKFKMRPGSNKAPALVLLTDALIWIDREMFAWSGRSVGKGVILHKPR